MDFKFGDIVVGASDRYSYTDRDTYWMVVFAYEIPIVGGSRQRIRVVGTTNRKNRDFDFFKEYAYDLLGNYSKWVTRFTRQTYYDMTEEMRAWMIQFDKYRECLFITFEVDPADFKMAKPFFISNKDGALTLKKLGD